MNVGGLPHRLGVGIFLMDSCRRRVFVGKRVDIVSNFWQMPQGGIEASEPPRSAAFRELKEETGVSDAELLAETAGWLEYQFPADLASKLWHGRYSGQRQKWFAMVIPHGGSINLNSHHKPEFIDWKWQEPQKLSELAAPFKRKIYEEVVAEFAALLAS